jgi:hypothetical protein
VYLTTPEDVKNKNVVIINILAKSILGQFEGERGIIFFKKVSDSYSGAVSKTECDPYAYSPYIEEAVKEINAALTAAKWDYEVKRFKPKTWYRKFGWVEIG